MQEAITLDDIIYKDKQYKIGSKITVDNKDVRKLEKIGAIRCLKKTNVNNVEINVIKNPIKVTQEVKKNKKRKYNRRNKDFIKRG